MPLPMKPSQLTVLTKASASTSIKFPRLRTTMLRRPSVVPLRAYVYRRVQRHREAGQHPFHARLCPSVEDADLLDQPPVARSVNQELCLLATLAVHVVQSIP